MWEVLVVRGMIITIHEVRNIPTLDHATSSNFFVTVNFFQMSVVVRTTCFPPSATLSRKRCRQCYQISFHFCSSQSRARKESHCRLTLSHIYQIHISRIIFSRDLKSNHLKSGLIKGQFSNGRALAMAIALVPTIQKPDHL